MLVAEMTANRIAKMDPIESTRRLRDEGRFRVALETLDSARSVQLRPVVMALRAELLERLGLMSQAEALANQPSDLDNWTLRTALLADRNWTRSS